MTRLPPAHRRYLSMGPFNFGCSTAVFPDEEIRAIAEQGHLLEALAAGKVPPVNAEQRHFLKVDRDEAEPRTLLERAWLRLKGRREFEQDERVPKVSRTADDYGMIEFDEDRCWW